jgi:hypothetical protein
MGYTSHIKSNSIFIKYKLYEHELRVLRSRGYRLFVFSEVVCCLLREDIYFFGNVNDV